MATYEFKTEDEETDDWQRTIIKTSDVPAITTEVEVILNETVMEISGLTAERDAINIQIAELEAQITEAKTSLNIKERIEPK